MGSNTGVPAEYQGREQSYLKHRVLKEYLLEWGIKLGSVARRGLPVRLCYVDCFAGPWEAKDAAFADTSIALALDALEAAAATWRSQGSSIAIDAYFVEKDKDSFAALQQILASRSGNVRTQAFRGEFGDHGGTIRACLKEDPAFVFVDPTGWKGAEIHRIAPLLSDGKMRDVLVNVMFDHINRFKDDPRRFLRTQMREFFGLDDRDMPPGLGEEELFALYRRQIKLHCGIAYAADLAIPHPTMSRTKFRLVVGGKNPAVLEVFRGIEKKVIGVEAAAVREQAVSQAKEARTGQLPLLMAPPATDLHYESFHARALAQAPRDILERIGQRRTVRFADLWPELLEVHHLTKTQLAQVIWQMHEQGEICIENKQHRERSVKDDHVLALVRLA
ncbi:three-Cys-motif partner protein TcmP [Polyangium jinanense]|uniref:three-Cys-motif partner protein TcmP n=1 Tax=Polyangium jinanense TaxID=2829994 RepID=UPI00234026CE|nr:three-Cys-motif partner protein TcmP [Polyangium jinanense]MDC3960735.1 three-Cys-motif partner protein TcmP [Polyangium jinanense]